MPDLISNCSAAQSVNASTPLAVSGTTLGSPVEPEVVSMNVTSSPPPAGGHSDSGASGAPRTSSTSARRLAALWLRGPWGESTWLVPAWANSWASVSGASSIDGRRNDLPARRQARISPIASGDFLARMPTGRSSGSAASWSSAKEASLSAWSSR